MFGKLFISIFMIFLALNAQAEDVEKKGFLTTKWCAENGLFADCRMETIFCGYEGCHKDQKEFNTDVNGKIVLHVHSEGKYYNTEFAKGLKLGEVLEEAMNKNEVTLIGEIEENTIKVHEFKAPPPPAKSFFKGCL